MRSGLEVALNIAGRALIVRDAAVSLAAGDPLCGPGCCDAILGAADRAADTAMDSGEMETYHHIRASGRALAEDFHHLFRPDPVLDAEECDEAGLPRRGWWLGEAKYGADLDRRLIALGFAEAMVATGDLEDVS